MESLWRAYQRFGVDSERLVYWQIEAALFASREPEVTHTVATSPLGIVIKTKAGKRGKTEVLLWKKVAKTQQTPESIENPLIKIMKRQRAALQEVSPPDTATGLLKRFLAATRRGEAGKSPPA